MLKAAIFDMDGLLIDSEPIWQSSEISIFKHVNVTLTREMCMQTMGLRLDEVIQHWFERYPWEHVPHAVLERQIIDLVIDNIMQHAGAMDGVYEILEFFRSKGIRMALASSSCFRIIHTVIDKLKIRDFFEVVHSAEVEEYGKPHPAIYINTAKKLHVAPTHCVALEDSFNGLIAAKAARMKAIAVPEPSSFHEPRFGSADLKLKSLKDLTEELWKELAG